MPRHPEFERDEVVRAAQEVFWTYGYGQTTVQHLVAATGLKPGSLYCAFGSKKGVYIEVLDAYNRRFLAGVRELQDHESGALAGLVSVIDDIIDNAVTGKDRRGCLAVNALSEMSDDPDIAARLAANNERTIAAFADVVRTAQGQGDIDPNRDANDVAVFLVNNIWGLRVMCRTATNRSALNAVAAGIIAGVGNQQQKARLRIHARISPAR